MKQYSEKKEKINDFKILIDDVQNIISPAGIKLSVTINCTEDDFMLVHKAMEDILSTSPCFSPSCPSIIISPHKHL